MNYLLDTHTFFWTAVEPSRLPSGVYAAISDDSNSIGVSIASFWEMAIKANIGKWDLPITLQDLRQFTQDEYIQILPITVEATEIVRNLPLHHSDPFDRIIIATALIDGAVVLSVDDKLDAYEGLRRFWA